MCLLYFFTKKNKFRSLNHFPNFQFPNICLRTSKWRAPRPLEELRVAAIFSLSCSRLPFLSLFSLYLVSLVSLYQSSLDLLSLSLSLPSLDLRVEATGGCATTLDKHVHLAWWIRHLCETLLAERADEIYKRKIKRNAIRLALSGRRVSVEAYHVVCTEFFVQ